MSSSTVSYSRLSTFLECPELYRLRYIVKPEGYYEPLQEALIKGSLAHACIEEYLKGADKQSALEIALMDWVVNLCGLPIQEGKVEKRVEQSVTIYDDWEEDNDDGFETYPEGEGIDFELLTKYALECGYLLHRCSGTYNDVDKIRNIDGTLPKNPLAYPPNAFKKAYYEANLDKARLELDNQAVRSNLSFKRMSFANVAAWGAAYVFNFEIPKEISKVDAVEKGLAEKKVLFGPKKDKYWNGYIDTIYSTEDGAVVINDHKTEKNKRRPEDVAFDLQLNSYAAVIFEQTNKLPDYISITHLASNSFIVSHTNPEVMSLSMEYLEQIQEEIELQIENRGVDEEWMKKWPSKYGSPCIQRRDDVITRVCPYIRRCWPDYAGCINDELVEYLGY
jgi:hypothetical protein